MTKLDPARNTKAALTKRRAVVLWRKAFGEPPPIIAEPRLVAAIIEEYAAKRAIRRDDDGEHYGPR